MARGFSDNDILFHINKNIEQMNGNIRAILLTNIVIMSLLLIGSAVMILWIMLWMDLS